MKASSPLSLQHRLTYAQLGPDQQLSQTLLLTLTAEDLVTHERPPVTLMLCVDTSGSMMGRPLEQVFDSIRMLLKQLNADDRLGMVTFSNRGRLISEPRPLDAMGQGFYQGVLSGIQASGSTHLEEGIQLALQHMPKPRANELSHIILLSDGKPNRGLTVSRQLAQLVERDDQGLTLSCFGYGLKHDEDLLELLARTGGGSYAYVEGAETAPLAFAKELGSLFSTVANRIQLILQPATGCTVLRLHGSQKIAYTAQGMMLEIPDLIANQQAHMLFDLQFHTCQTLGRTRALDMELRYQLPGSVSQEVAKAHSVDYEVQAQPALQADPIVQTHILLQEVSEAWRHAHDLADQKRFPDAINQLQPYLSKLNTDKPAALQAVCKNWYEQIIDEINILSQRPDEERYRRVRKVARSEMKDPVGLFRRGNTSMVDLNTTQRHLLSEMMLKAVGMPHAYLILTSAPSEVGLRIGKIYPILGETSIGRLAQVKLDHNSVGKRHVRLVATPSGYLLLDLMATNPPKINQRPVRGPTLLKEDDKIQIGQFVLTFHKGLAPNLKEHNQQSPVSS